MRPWHALLLWLSTLLLVFAQPAPLCARSDYEVALERALRAHAEGDFEEARTSMERANALEPNARTLRGLGIIAFAQERYLAAVAPLEEALASPVRPLTPELRLAVEELLARIWVRVGRMRLQVDPADAVVRVDGKEPTWHGKQEILLDPGEHQLQIGAADYEEHVRLVRIAAGSHERLVVHLLPVVSVEDLTPAPQEHGSADALPWWSPRTRNLALSGASLVAASGVALWLTALLKLQDVDAACRALPAGGCTPSDATRRFERAHIQPYARAGVTLGVLGGAALVSGLSLSLWKRHRREVDVTLGAAGLQLLQTF